MDASCFAEGEFKAEFLVCRQPCNLNCTDSDCLNQRKEIRLLSEIRYSLPDQTRLTVCPGFEFDGASIPQICWTSTGHPLEHRFLYAALLHDALYSTQYLSREISDRYFKQFLRDFSGVGTFTAWKMFSAVRLFGGKAWNGKSDTQISAARMVIHLDEVPQ